MTSYPPPPPGAGSPAAYGAPVPPPAAPVSTQAVAVPVVAWLVPVAALLALIGAVTPWFKARATLSADGQTLHHSFDALYAVRDGKLGLLAPILLVGLAIGVVALLLGKSPAHFSRGSHPVSSAGRFSVGVGAVSLVCVLIAWFFVKSQYRFKDGGKTYSWDDYIKAAKNAGVKLELSRGPQFGYFLTAAAALLAIVAGLLMIMAARGKAADAAPGEYPQPGAAASPPQPAAGFVPAPGTVAQPETAAQQGPPPPRAPQAPPQ